MRVEVQDLTKSYRKGVRALDGLNLELAGGMVGLLGANGAGKTTLIRILAGIIRPTSGSVRVAGHDLSRAADRMAVKRLLGYLPQHLDLYPDLSAREFLDYIGLLKGIDSRSKRVRHVDLLLEQVGLAEVADRRTGGYSGGMKRRVGIAQALLGEPQVIIVDEPTAGLDPEERMRFRALLAGLGGDRTIILSTHIIDDVAQTCSQVAVLNRGRLVRHGNTGDLVAVARGRTYVTDPAAGAPTGDVAVVSAQNAAGGIRYRIVTDQPPVGATPVEPTLEDGYVALLRTRQDPATGADLIPAEPRAKEH
ncbi:ABC transporter ATP-binding protein [Frankia sp. R82]|uniref:ABC transporter ATP-binding protein n=1 Tax=Frankia sp. R82 TaxID=2950553 RepID=UPI0020435326|nr:ABC transporter ATP-binding protein [Frankia sp. R82]MCM3886090.1 ABC transporter ATP-binding protein [Frankia sp. R82]